MKFIPENEFSKRSRKNLTTIDALKAIEALGKNIDAKFAEQADEIKSLNERLDAEEAKAKRPGGGERKTKTLNRKKAFETFIRKGREAIDARTKSNRSIVSNSQQGGYLAPAEFVAELDRNLVMYSPVRSVARVMNTGAGTVILPKRIGRLDRLLGW